MLTNLDTSSTAHAPVRMGFAVQPATKHGHTASNLAKLDRRHRNTYPDAHQHQDGWRALLEIAASAEQGRRFAISELALAIDIPSTTALRRVEELVASGLVERQADRLDKRRVWIELTNRGQVAVDAWIEQL